ncbi:Ubiquitin-like protease domain-containing protein [Forsythia ovata]|uniref:Ubiquitin-like protease domain-containing protein n=1 Tax=Forsythia ovata TaxID=205694 RepID=A0ABD1VIE1_9LAMI
MTPLDDVEDSRVDYSLNEDGVEESEEDERNEQYPYNFHGFPHAVMIWTFEAIPALGQQFAHRLEGDRIPRMSGWEFQQTKLDGESVSKFLDTKIQRMQFRMKRTLVPSQEEAEEEFCRGMIPLDDSELKGFDTYSPHHEDNVPEENKGREEDCVFEAAIENSVNVEDCTYEEEQVTPIQGEGPRSTTGQG